MDRKISVPVVYCFCNSNQKEDILDHTLFTKYIILTQTTYHILLNIMCTFFPPNTSCFHCFYVVTTMKT